MMLEAERLKFLVFAHHLTMLQACTEAVIEAKVECKTALFALCSIRSWLVSTLLQLQDPDVVF